MNREQWESEVADYLSTELDITTSDAQGIVAAETFVMTQEWSKGSTPTQAGDRLI